MHAPLVYQPTELRCADTVIITTNHLGASMLAADGVSYGDSGKDAQYLANISGQRVVGLDRPHTGNGATHSTIHAKVMVEQPELVAAAWAKQFPPVLQALGAERVALVGRSAGANFLLEVALLELLPVSGVATVDPVGIRTMSLIKRRARYAAYKVLAEPRRKPQPLPENNLVAIGELQQELIRHEGPLTSMRRKLHRQYGDTRQYQHAWATDKTYWAMALLAAKFRQTSTLLNFAGQPLAAKRDDVEAVVATLKTLANRKPHEAAFAAGFIEGTTHSSFDNPRNYAAHYLQYAAFARPKPVAASMQTIESDLL